jgi:hypothetical protein
MSGMPLRRIAVFATLTAVLASPVLAADLRSQASARPSPSASLLDAAMALLDGFWAQVSAAVGDNGPGIDPNGGDGGLAPDNGPGIDPNGGEGLTVGDNGPGIDPNG